MADRSKKRHTKFLIDSTPYSSVVRCMMCSWRASSTSKRGSYRQIADHLRFVHGENKAANDARYSATRHYTTDRFITDDGSDDDSLRETA